MDSRGDSALCLQLSRQGLRLHGQDQGTAGSARLQTTPTVRLKRVRSGAHPDPPFSLALQGAGGPSAPRPAGPRTARAGPLPLIQVLLPHLRVSGHSRSLQI